MTEWQPIKTAPKDGTVVRVKNDCMERSVKAAWGKYKSANLPHLPVSDQWVLVEDDGERFMPMARGSLIIPTHWQPV